MNCVRVATIEDLLKQDVSIKTQYLFGYIEELNSYAFVIYYESQNSYFIGASAVESGEHRELIIETDERCAHHAYLMDDSVLSVIVWDGVSPFEAPSTERFVINSEEETVTKTELPYDEFIEWQKEWLSQQDVGQNQIDFP